MLGGTIYRMIWIDHSQPNGRRQRKAKIFLSLVSLRHERDVLVAFRPFQRVFSPTLLKRKLAKTVGLACSFILWRGSNVTALRQISSDFLNLIFTSLLWGILKRPCSVSITPPKWIGARRTQSVQAGKWNVLFTEETRKFTCFLKIYRPQNNFNSKG